MPSTSSTFLLLIILLCVSGICVGNTNDKTNKSENVPIFNSNGPLNASAFGLNDPLSKGFVRIINIIIHLLLDQGLLLVDAIKEKSLRIAEGYVTSLLSISNMFKTIPTGINELAEVLGNLKIALQNIDGLIREFESLGVPTNVIPIVFQLRLGLTASIPAIGAVQKTLQALGAIKKEVVEVVG